MLTAILLTATGAVVLVALFVATRPAGFAIERSTVIAAPAAAVFAQVNDLRRWPAWSPWAAKDPQMKQTYEGPAAGVGAGSAWTGNREVGEGRMTIVESRPNESVQIRLEFFKPFAATNSAAFAFREAGGQTTVTWTMRGRNHFIGKAMALCFDVDRRVGGDFEKGLASLKAIVESARDRAGS